MFKNILSALCVVFGLSMFCHAADSADNSAKNKKQVQNKELDAHDQGNSKGDVELTAEIRKSVVAENSFSTNAKNIKIITVNGEVTLKGPVGSVEEKNKIRMIATRIAGKDQVFDQIEVLPKKIN